MIFQDKMILKGLLWSLISVQLERLCYSSRNCLFVLVRTLSKHCCLNKHVYNISILDASRFCNIVDETSKHLLCQSDPLQLKNNWLLHLQVFYTQKVLQYKASHNSSYLVYETTLKKIILYNSIVCRRKIIHLVESI